MRSFWEALLNPALVGKGSKVGQKSPVPWLIRLSHVLSNVEPSLERPRWQVLTSALWAVSEARRVRGGAGCIITTFNLITDSLSLLTEKGSNCKAQPASP